MTVRKVVEIEWVDANTASCSLTLKEIKDEMKPLPAKSTGYLIHKTKEYVVLCLVEFECDPPLFKHVHLVPKCLIKKITVLREEKK